jgi:hypothetical protein
VQENDLSSARTQQDIDLDIAAARKLLYQIHHKLKDLGRLVNYELPRVRLVGKGEDWRLLTHTWYTANEIMCVHGRFSDASTMCGETSHIP